MPNVSAKLGLNDFVWFDGKYSKRSTITKINRRETIERLKTSITSPRIR